jgi:DNA adenine methylase
MTRSFLKWAGGKHRVADALLNVIKEKKPFDIEWNVNPGERYHEPMLGSGSMFFKLKSAGFINTRKKSFLSDINFIIISTMQTVASNNSLPKLILQVKELQEQYPLDLPHPNPRNQTKEKRENRMFYKKRKRLNELSQVIETLSESELIELAAITIFLNKTCFNGLWRMNSNGEFNTPEGGYSFPNNICQELILLNCNKSFSSSELKVQDWNKSLKAAKKGDLVYIDPPYMPLRIDDSTFTDYFTDGFTIENQIELANSLAVAAKKGVRIIASNHDTEGNPNVREIYNNAAILAEIKPPEVHSIDVSRTISCKGKGRVKVKEVLIFMTND